MTQASSLLLEPVLSFPREAQIGSTYLFTVDLRSPAPIEDWPYPRTEEVTVYCFVDASPLFKSVPIGEPAVVLHRYGGTYGPAQFLLTPEPAPGEGVIRVTLANGFGVPMGVIETGNIEVRDRVETAPSKAARVIPRRAEPPSPKKVDVTTDEELLRAYLVQLRENPGRDAGIVILTGLLSEIGAKLDHPVQCRYDGAAGVWQWFDASGPYNASRGVVQVLEDVGNGWMYAPTPQVGQDLLPYLPVLTTNFLQFELVSQPPGQQLERVGSYFLVDTIYELSNGPDTLAAVHAEGFISFLRTALSYDSRGARDDYAIVVGGGRYDRFPFLEGSLPDATRFAQWLTGSSGGMLPPDHVTLLDSPSLSEFDDLIREAGGTGGQHRHGRRLFLYFAGYCFASASDSILVLTRDAAPDRSDGCISIRRYTEFLALSADFEEIVVFVDCSRLGVGWQEREPPFKIVDRPLPPALQFILVNGDRGPRGQLTSILLQGLEGAAADSEGAIDTDSLVTYIRRVQAQNALRPSDVVSLFSGAGRIVLRSKNEPLPLWELAFDEDGEIADAQSLALIAYQLQERGITDVFLFVHGWNVDRAQALDKLRHFGAGLDDGAVAMDTLRPQRFGVIGVVWPSKVWSGDDAFDDAELESEAQALNDSERKTLEEAVSRVQTKPDDPGTQENLWGLVRKLETRLGNKVVPNQPEEPRKQGSSGFLGSLGQNVMNTLRTASYYQMRHRAGVVGEIGLGPAIGQLSAILPSMRIHLVGNSIGARLAGYALKKLAESQTGQLPVKSLIMLQAVVSNQIFSTAHGGVLSTAFVRVGGPIVVTYSRNDVPAGTIYGLLTRLVGKDSDSPGETSNFTALGSSGAKGVPTTDLQLGTVNTFYPFVSQKIFNIDASSVIRSHGDTMSPEIGWLILSTARSPLA